MAVQASALNMGCAVSPVSATWRSRSILLVLMTAIAMYFWVDSRYPALMKRYHAGTQIKASGALTFGAVYQVDRSMPYLQRVGRTTVNWLDANRAGMTFSFLFGPAVLAFFSTLRTRRTRSRYLNTLLGAAAAVPVGVCSNCIAPIARGLFVSGTSTESVLGGNVRFAGAECRRARHVVLVVPTFPRPHELGSVLFLILVFVPAISAGQAEPQPVVNFATAFSPSENWREAATTVVRSYLMSFWIVFRVAFPLMILAAILGAFAVELIPPVALTGHATTLGILAVAAISAFLPVPMAFDVAIAYILMAHGTPLPYVAAILCTLGIISVYSLSVMGKTISWKTAAATYAMVVCLGSAVGFATLIWH